MKFTKNDISIMEKISLISGVTQKDIRSVFESLSFLLIANYAEGEDIEIPLIGKVRLAYKGDKNKEELKRSIDAGDVDLNDFIVKNVHQVKNNEETEVTKLLLQKIHSSLGEYLNKGE